MTGRSVYICDAYEILYNGCIQYLRNEMSGAVTEEHQHGQELFRLLCVITETLQKQSEASLGPELTDKCPQFGQQLIQICQSWKVFKKL